MTKPLAIRDTVNSYLYRKPISGQLSLGSYAEIIVTCKFNDGYNI